MITKTLVRRQVSPDVRHALGPAVARETCGSTKGRRAHRPSPDGDGAARRRSTTLAVSLPDFRGGECLARRGTAQVDIPWRTAAKRQREALVPIDHTRDPESIPWTRRWRPRNLTPAESLSADVFFGNGQKWENFSDLPCIAMLGEPGSGKTHELNRARRANGENHGLIDLRRCSSDTDFRARLDEELNKAAQLPAEPFTLWIDAIDEGLLILKTIFRALPDEVAARGLNSRQTFRLRLACRTGAWPNSLENSLQEIFYKKSVPCHWIFDLLPLQESDWRLYCEHTDIDPSFIASVQRARAEVLAERPVTLLFLARYYAQNLELPTSRGELYQGGIDRLIYACNEDRVTDGILVLPNHENALRKLGILASAMLFTGNLTLQLSLRALRPGELRPSSVFDDQSDHASLDHLIRHTALFRMDAPDTFTFSHRTFMEYLCAYVVGAEACDDAVIRDILLGHDGVVVEHLREAASWIATKRPSLQRYLLENDPSLTLAADPALLDRGALHQACYALIGLVDDAALPDLRSDAVDRLTSVPDSVLDAVLGETLDHGSQHSDDTLSVALVVFTRRRLVRLTSRVADVVANDKHSTRIRLRAIQALEIVDPSLLPKLLAQFLRLDDNAPSNAIAGRALIAAGMADLSADAFFHGLDLIAPDGEIGGETWTIMTQKLPQVVSHRGWETHAIDWLRRAVADRAEPPDWQSSHVEAAWRWASRRKDDQTFVDAFVQMLAAFGRRHESVVPAERRIADASVILPVLQTVLAYDQTETAEAAMRALNWWSPSTEDLGWLLEMHRTSNDPQTSRRVRALLDRSGLWGDPSMALMLYNASVDDSDLVSGMPWFFGPIPMNSHAARWLATPEEPSRPLPNEAVSIDEPANRLLSALDQCTATPCSRAA